MIVSRLCSYFCKDASDDETDIMAAAPSDKTKLSVGRRPYFLLRKENEVAKKSLPSYNRNCADAQAGHGFPQKSMTKYNKNCASELMLLRRNGFC